MRFLLALATASGLAATVDAALILQASNVAVPQGGTGILTVTLQNTGPTAVDLAGYQIQLATSAPGVRFTWVDRSPPQYLFPGTSGPISSDFDPPFFAPPVTAFTATDFTTSLLGFDTLGSGETVGVLWVWLAADPADPLGSGAIRFVLPGAGPADLTQLVDGQGILVPFTAIDGRVTVVPEPASSVILGMGTVVALCVARHSRSRRKTGLAL